MVPASTAEAKLEQIRFYGGQIHPVEDPGMVYAESERLAAETGGHYLDQFTFAERATDWRGNNNIAQSIFSQMSEEDHPDPTWIVCGAGTGGTSATLGRYIRYQRRPTQLCVADPAGSVFHRHYADRAVETLDGRCECRIEGIGRARVEPSFEPGVIDRMIAVQDADSIGAMFALSKTLGRKVGGSTGTNLFACLQLIEEMASAGQTGSIVTLLCDDGARYASTYYSEEWLAEWGGNWRPAYERMLEILE